MEQPQMVFVKAYLQRAQRMEAHRKSFCNLIWELSSEQQTLGLCKDPNFTRRPEYFYLCFDFELYFFFPAKFQFTSIDGLFEWIMR